jgi:glycine/D-amino acid oxidase-like deaminating enzyme
VSQLSAVRARNSSAWLLPNDGTRTNHRLRADMRRYADTDEVDLVIVGCGAGGSTLLQRLARAGWQVVGMDAGPFWDPDAHDVEVYPAAALVFALLGGHEAGMPGGQQATGLASERAHRVEVIRGVQRHVDVQSLAAGRLDEGRQAEFAFEQVPQRERGLPDLVELVGIRRVEIEHQLVRVLEPAEPAEKDMQLNAGLVSQVDQGGGLVADDMPHGTVLLAYLRARLTQSGK